MLRRPPPIVHGLRPTPNHVRFRLSPEFTIALGASVREDEGRVSGNDLELIASHERDGAETDPYAELLGDAAVVGGALPVRPPGLRGGGLAHRGSGAGREGGATAVRAWYLGTTGGRGPRPWRLVPGERPSVSGKEARNSSQPPVGSIPAPITQRHWRRHWTTRSGWSAVARAWGAVFAGSGGLLRRRPRTCPASRHPPLPPRCAGSSPRDSRHFE